jgi:hypothetical protein
MSHINPTYRLYIDESGTPSYEDCAGTDRQFLCVTGVIMSLKEAKDVLHPNFERIKSEIFPSHHPDNPVIIHRDEIVKRGGNFWPLRDPKINKLWEDALMSVLENTEFKCISVVINKQSYKEKYGDAAHHPYIFVLNVILERYLKFLTDIDEFGDVMVESRGGVEDNKMKQEYERLFQHGTYYDRADAFQKRLTSKDIKIKTKLMNVSGLQLADLLCHPIKYYILRAYKECEDKSGDFAKRICATLIAKDRFFKSEDRSSTKRIVGFGLKYLK